MPMLRPPRRVPRHPLLLHVFPNVLTPPPRGVHPCRAVPPAPLRRPPRAQRSLGLSTRARALCRPSWLPWSPQRRPWPLRFIRSRPPRCLRRSAPQGRHACPPLPRPWSWGRSSSARHAVPPLRPPRRRVVRPHQGLPPARCGLQTLARGLRSAKRMRAGPSASLRDRHPRQPARPQRPPRLPPLRRPPPPRLARRPCPCPGCLVARGAP